MNPLPPILAANIVDDRLLYEWDEWDVHEYFDFPDEALEAQLMTVSRRASMALALAAGEWICHRYSGVSADPAPMQYLEAAWAEQMHLDTAAYVETDDDEWRGIVRGPLSLVITIANDALLCLDEDEETSIRAAWMTNLARHVLPNADAFERWLEAVIARLMQHHPRENEVIESMDGDVYGTGRPIARELFDTGLPVDPPAEAALIEAFLRSVDPQNPFLAKNVPDEEP